MVNKSIKNKNKIKSIQAKIVDIKTNTTYSGNNRRNISYTANISYKIDDKEYFSINIMYKAQLKSYKKTNFDPFRRDRKFLYNYDKSDDKKQVITTLGQLNFFKWAISNNIIECVEKHYPAIIEAMNKSNKEDKVRKNKKKMKKIGRAHV